jgi:hypothetical protein
MRFENCVRSILAFFAALIGFGLKHILDADPKAYGDIVAHRWQYFLVAVLCFLDFLLVQLITFGLSMLRHGTPNGNRKFKLDYCCLISVS